MTGETAQTASSLDPQPLDADALAANLKAAADQAGADALGVSPGDLPVEQRLANLEATVSTLAHQLAKAIYQLQMHGEILKTHFPNQFICSTPVEG